MITAVMAPCYPSGYHTFVRDLNTAQHSYQVDDYTIVNVALQPTMLLHCSNL